MWRSTKGSHAIPDTRDAVWANIEGPWDVVVIGGGITGAGVLHEAASAGLRALLLEKRDFSFGTSSRSGKMLHGGVRYIRNWQFGVSYDSVREREHFVREMPGLVRRQVMYYLSQKDDSCSSLRLGADLTLYELLAGRLGVRRVSNRRLMHEAPLLQQDNIAAAYVYSEGVTDDSRLVLRVLAEARKCGGLALNYAGVIRLVKRRDGQVAGVVAADETPEGAGRTAEIIADVVINATGYEADGLRMQVGAMPAIRKSRGSHLVFSGQRLPVCTAICYYHPDDGRIQFVLPWQGVVVAGTTDIDYLSSPDGQPDEPRILAEEVEYILKGLRHTFPSARIQAADVQSTFCGVRPLVRGGADNPSKESRQHVIWDDAGMITVAGGKMTTYRLMAHDALRMARRRLTRGGHTRLRIPRLPRVNPDLVQLDDQWERMWLAGGYGELANDVLQSASPEERTAVAATPTLWAEVRWAILQGFIVHLDDLMLRHTRLGLTLPEGGLQVIPRIRSTAGRELGWNDSRWTAEIAAYQRRWRHCYSLPT